MAKQEPIRLTLPLDREVVKTLKAGQACTLSGPLFTLRDAGHQRLLEEMASDNNLPYGLSDQTIFYAGPTPGLHAKLWRVFCCRGRRSCVSC